MLKPGGLFAYAVTVSLLGLFLLEPSTAQAYVGPSAAIGFFSAAFGLLLALFSAIFVVLLWPVRMLFRKIKTLFATAPEEVEQVSETN